MNRPAPIDRTKVLVHPQGKLYAVRWYGAEKARRTGMSKAAAIALARSMRPGIIFVHGPDGNVERAITLKPAARKGRA